MKPQNTDKVTARPWEAKPWTCHAETCIMHNNQPIAETSGLGNDVDLCEANAALIVKAVNEHAALVAVAETDMTETLYAEYCAKSPDVNSASFEMIQAGMKQHRANVANLAAVREGKAQ